MSIKLRVRYQYRSLFQFFHSFRVPEFLTGRAARTIITTSIIVLTIGYVVQLSELTTGGYQIASLEKQVAKLSDETQKLNSEVATYQSINSVQKRISEINMVPAGKITYVKTEIDTAMAKR